MSLIPDLIDFFPDEMTVERWVSQDAHGEPAYDEANPFTIKARIVGRTKLIADEDGEEHVSSVQATTAGAYNLNSKDRFTLPLRFSVNPVDPNDLGARQPLALAIDRSSDENGPHHEIVQFSNARLRSY